LHDDCGSESVRLAVRKQHHEQRSARSELAAATPPLAQRRSEPGCLPARPCRDRARRGRASTRTRRSRGATDVARARERDESDAVPVQVLDQPRASRTRAAAAGCRVLRSTNERVHRDHYREGRASRRRSALAPARAGQRDDAEEGGDRECGGSSRPAATAWRTVSCDQSAARRIGAPRPGRGEPDGAADERRDREYDRASNVITALARPNVPASTISRASATSPMRVAHDRPHRNAVNDRSTGVFSSDVSSKIWRTIAIGGP